MSRHSRRRAAGSMRFECPACEEATSTLEMLARHVDKAHCGYSGKCYRCLCGHEELFFAEFFVHFAQSGHLDELAVLCAMRRVAT